MELMESTSPSSYSTVLELDKKIRDLSAAISVCEDEQFNGTAATMEWNCILGANVRQAGEYLFRFGFYGVLFPSSSCGLFYARLPRLEISISNTLCSRGCWSFFSLRFQLPCRVG